MDLQLQSLSAGREQFMEWVSAFRPELHRYCARMMGSAIDGEDVLQDALAKAFFQLSQSVSLPPLKPWLLRIAHNTALDHLKRYERRHADVLDDAVAETLVDDAADPATVRAALALFLDLPVLQRSAVVLKDVLGLSAEEIAETLQTTVPAVKAALVRGRTKLAEAGQPAHAAPTLSAGLRATLDQWVSRFNARDWDGLRALLAKDVELDLVAKAQRRGAEVSQYFGNYAKDDVTLTLGEVDGRVVLGVFRRGADAPAYVIQLDVGPNGVRVIRDYRYVPYLGAALDFRPLA
jgi:RNA polymerase sigma-70 factor (ECF subfamily)